MKRKVHFIKTFVRELDNGIDEYLSVLQEFDEGGNNLKTQEFDETGNVIYELQQKFNNDNKIVFSDIVSEKDEYGEKKTYSYNENGQLQSEEIEYDGGWFSTKNYEYNPETKVLKITCVDEDGEIEEIVVIEYNEKNLVVCQKEYDEYNKLKSAIKNAYNDDNTIDFKEEYDNKEKLEKTTKYLYNENGKLLGLKVFNRKEKLLDWIKIEYDESDRPTEQLSMSGAKICIEYDSEGKSSTESHYASGGAVLNKVVTIKDDDENIIEEQTNSKITKYIYEYYD